MQTVIEILVALFPGINSFVERTVGAALRGRPRFVREFKIRAALASCDTFINRGAATEGRPYSSFRDLGGDLRSLSNFR